MGRLARLTIVALMISACSSPAATGSDTGTDTGAARDASGTDASGTDASGTDASAAPDANRRVDTGPALRCTSASACFGATPACDVASGTCVACRSDADCGALHCDPASGECRDCAIDSHCGAPPAFCDIGLSRQCTRHCATDADCPQMPGTPGHCLTSRGVCVDCTGNGMACTFCEPQTYSCVGCITNADCPMARPTCGPSRECTATCASSTDCPGVAAPVCDPTTHLCVECATNADCTSGVCHVDHTCG